MLIEYNELMTTAGLGHIAMEQMVRHNPNPTTYEFPDSMLGASDDAKREYIKNKVYRECKKTRGYLMEYRKQRVRCYCGQSVSRPNIRIHQRSAKCRANTLRAARNPHSKDHERASQALEHLKPSLEVVEVEQPLLPPLLPPLS